MSKQYAERDASALDEAGGYYIRHVSAMTKEGLHSKSDIAAELAFRDLQIDQLNHRINRLLTERNATGLAIDHALNGDLPEQHGLLSRLQMLSLVAAQREELLSMLDAVVGEIIGLIEESSGVYGLHLNGDTAPWGELENGGRFERLSTLPSAVDLIAKTKGGAS